MNKNMKKRTLSKRAARSVKYIPDSQIDFSDIPEAADEELEQARRVGRPRSGAVKQLIAIRVDPKLLTSLRRMAAKAGKPYQTLIHEFLERECLFRQPLLEQLYRTVSPTPHTFTGGKRLVRTSSFHILHAADIATFLASMERLIALEIVALPWA